MNVWGWFFLVGSWLVILTVFAFCMKRTLKPDGNSSVDDGGDE